VSLLGLVLNYYINADDFNLSSRQSGEHTFEWKWWNIISWKIIAIYVYICMLLYQLQKDSLKNFRTELSSKATHDHCNSSKWSTNWAVDWLKSVSAGTKARLSLNKTPLVNNSHDTFKILITFVAWSCCSHTRNVALRFLMPPLLEVPWGWQEKSNFLPF